MWWIFPAAGAGTAWLLSKPPKSPPLPPVAAMWKPGLWALGACTTAYVGLAALEGLHNRHTNGSYSRSLAEEKEICQMYRWDPHGLAIQGSLSIAILGLNLIGYNFGTQSRLLDLADCHQSDWTRNWTLLTAAFCHLNSTHLIGNMVSLLPEVPTLLQACGQSPYQFAAFYICAAIFGTYTQRVSSYRIWIQKWASRFDFTKPRNVGASGVMMAVLAASLFTQSWSSPSFNVIFSACIFGSRVATDIWGLFFSDQNVGFAAHLAGTIFGALYVYLDADNHVWKKLVRFFSGRGNEKNQTKPPTRSENHGDLDLDEIVSRLNSSI